MVVYESMWMPLKSGCATESGYRLPPNQLCGEARRIIPQVWILDMLFCESRYFEVNKRGNSDLVCQLGGL